MLRRWLQHDRLLIRFSSLFVAVMALFCVAWTAGYFFLPEALVRGSTPAQHLAGEGLAGGSVSRECLLIFGINFAGMLLVFVAPNLFRSRGGYPFAYFTLVVVTILCGVVLGTDSFSIPMGGKVQPTLMVFGHPGFWEIIAYILAAAATATISRWRLVGKWPRQKTETLVPPRTKTALLERRLGFALAVAILFLAAAWEAHNIARALAIPDSTNNLEHPADEQPANHAGDDAE